MSQINKIAVIGAGNMGSGIAQKLAQTEEFVERGIKIIRQTLKEAVERKILSADQVHDVLSRIIGTCDFEMVAEADLVIEAVFEDKQVKFDLFEKTILATNTSSFYVREFAEKTARPDRFVGLHYFYHPAKNRLLEVIPHEKTSAETLEKSLLARPSFMAKPPSSSKMRPVLLSTASLFHF
jgi:enoyl-CoA hydratase/3-hydroxyacyl-CoA dehydrogenase